MMNLGTSLLTFVQSIAREKDLPYKLVLSLFADALAQALRKSAPEYRDAEFRVAIDPVNADVKTYRCWRVINEDEELMENPQSELMLESAQCKKPNAAIGDIIEEEMGEVSFDLRAGVQSAKQHFNSKLREAERKRLLDELLSRNEDLVSGQVLRILREHGDAIVEVLRVECRLPKRDMLPRESLKQGDRVQALIKETNAELRGQAIILTRTSPKFLERLFRQYVPEIEKGVLEIVTAVRDPGNRSKIAVRTSDERVDPVGTCVGIRGSRVQAVTNELNGERIDIIPWNDDDARYVLDALAPAEVSKINVDRERMAMDVLVEPDKLAQAIGKGGINVRLAAELTGWRLNLRTPEEYEQLREEEVAAISAQLAKDLNLEEEVARILFEEGFETLEHIAYAETGELQELEGFQAEMVSEIQSRAREIVEQQEADLNEKLELMETPLKTVMEERDIWLRQLARGDILSLEDFSDLAADELLEIVEMPPARARELIMRARDLMDADEKEAGESA